MIKYGIEFTQSDAQHIQNGLYQAIQYSIQETQSRQALTKLYDEIAAVTGIWSDQDDGFPEPNEKLKQLFKTKAPWE